MRQRRSDATSCGRRVTVLAVLALALLPGHAAAEEPADGGYGAYCAPCHGPTGRGDGRWADLFDPRPRDLKSGFLDRYDTEDLVRRIREGTPLSLDLDPEGRAARARDVEALATHLARLPTTDWELVDRGAVFYIVRCTACHEPAGHPSPSLPDVIGRPPDLSDGAVQHAMRDDDIRTAIRRGKGRMPAIPGPWRDADLRAVVAFIRVLSPGFELYETFCEGCHGTDGLGSTIVGQRGAPKVRFDRRYFRTRTPKAVRDAAGHMFAEQRPIMPHFRTRLTTEQARRIVEYLRQAR
ncbi:MAG: c-type cytochrome [Candidatus Binatia bacterium]